MKIKYQVLIYLTVIHIFIIGITIPLWPQNKLWLLSAEIFVLISIFLAFNLYKKLIRPVEFISSGIEALQNQDFQIKFVPTGNSDIDRMVHVYNTMIDCIRDEQIKIQEQHFFLQRLIQAAPVGIVIFDLDDHILQMNQKAESFFGESEQTLKGKSLNSISSSIALQLSLIPNNEAFTFSMNGNNKFRCLKSQFYDRGFQRHFMVIEDLTYELFEAEKTAYRKVIRVMSHETNNAVGAVNSLLDSIRIYAQSLESHEQSDFLDEIQIAIDRNRNMALFVSKFADLARLPVPNPQICELDKIVQRIVALMQKQCDDLNIQLEVLLDTSPCEVFVDSMLIEQVLLNIIKNAIESIEKDGKITLQINSKQKSIIIRDTGKGILPETTAKLFTPFFSTKRQGQGIGLALIREILSAHNARFSLETKLEGFTEFEIKFEGLGKS